MRASLVFALQVAAASALQVQLPVGVRVASVQPRASVFARDCIFDQEPCESSGECRVNSAFCDDNHGYRPVEPHQGRAKVCMKAPKPALSPRTLHVFEKAMREVEANPNLAK